MTALLVGVLLSLLGGVAMNFAWTEMEMTGRHVEEASSRLLAESGVEQVVAWFTHGEIETGTATAPDRDYDAARPEDDRFLNDQRTGAFRALAGLGRMTRLRLYGPAHPEGFTTVEVTAESKRGVRQTVSVELGATRIPPVRAAVQAGPFPASAGSPRVFAHWGDIRLAGDAHLGPSDQFPRKSDQAHVTCLGYEDPGAFLEDRWMEGWIGGTPQFEDPGAVLPPNVHANQDPVPGLPPSPWEYRKFKELAIRFGTYYVPDREGRLYRDGNMDQALAQSPAAVFGSPDVGAHRGLVFIDTLDQAPPSADNVATLVLDSSYMEGIFYVNAHVVLRSQGPGRAISALSPPTEGQGASASRVPVTIADVTIQGALHVAGSLQIERQVRVVGAVVAERGLTGSGLLEVWYNDDLGRGRVQGLPVVFPIRGTWREWGS